MLNMTKAKLTICKLLTSFLDPRQTLLNGLEKMSIPFEIMYQDLMRSFTTEKSPSSITFDDTDIPLEGVNHTKALYLTVS